jgi:hypothetical protein
MGSIPNGSAPLSSMRSPDLYTTLPGRTGKAQVRLAAAVRLRIAVALELVAGKVRALLDTVQTARGYSCRNGTSSPCMGQELRPCVPASGPTTLAEREELLRCWADSDSAPRGRLGLPLREDGKAGPRAGLSRPGQPRRQPDASRSTCRPYPHSTGPGLTRLGAGLHRAGRRRVNAGSTHVGHPSPRRDDNVRGARPLSASQAGFGLPAGRSRFMPGRGSRRPLSRPYRSGRRLGWEPLGRSTDSAGYPCRPSGASEPPGGTGLRQPSGVPGTAGSPSSSESPTIRRTLAACKRPRMARTTSRQTGSYSRPVTNSLFHPDD